MAWICPSCRVGGRDTFKSPPARCCPPPGRGSKGLSCTHEPTSALLAPSRSCCRQKQGTLHGCPLTDERDRRSAMGTGV